jgi:hypothetical protein
VYHILNALIRVWMKKNVTNVCSLNNCFLLSQMIIVLCLPPCSILAMLSITAVHSAG